MDWQFSVSLATDAGSIANRELTLLAKYAEGEHLSELRPVRQPLAYKSQRHIPGLFYMARLKMSVPYESRLEMVALKQLDFDPGLEMVLAQPCTIHFAADGGTTLSHTPDYLVWRSRCMPLLVDVKPRRHMNTERNQRAFAATKAAAESIGFSHTVQSELDPIYLANLNWISGYRRLPTQFQTHARTLIERAECPQPLGRLIHDLTPRAIVLPVLFHLIWLRHLEFDMNEPLCDHTEIRLAV